MELKIQRSDKFQVPLAPEPTGLAIGAGQRIFKFPPKPTRRYGCHGSDSDSRWGGTPELTALALSGSAARPAPASQSRQ